MTEKMIENRVKKLSALEEQIVVLQIKRAFDFQIILAVK